MSRFISLIVLLASIVIIGALFYKVMIGFFVPVFIAAVMVVVFRPLHRWIWEKVGQRAHLAAGITTALVIFSVLLPTAILLSMSAVQGTRLVSSIDTSSINIALNNARNRVGLQSPFQDNIRSIQAYVLEIQKVIGSSSKAELADSTEKLTGLSKKIKAEIDGLLPTFRKFIVGENQKNNDDDESTKNEGTLSIDKFRSALDQLIAATGVRVGTVEASELQVGDKIPSNVDLIELQAMAVRLGVEWQAMKDALLGGPGVLATLRELANPSHEQIKNFTSSAIDYLQPRIISITGATAEFLVRLLIGSAIMLVSLYFFLYDGPGMIRSLMKLSPLDDRYEMELLIEFDRISRAIVLAMIFSAIVQGLTAGLGFYMVGIPSLILLTLLSVLCGLIPFVGPSVIWVPVCIYLAVYEERYLASGLLAIWGLVAVASVDNVVKAYVLHGQSQLHPLLALLSVLGGVQALGPIGIVVGPISVVLLQTLLSILQRELTHLDQIPHAVVGTVSPSKSMSNWMSKLKPRPNSNSASHKESADATSEQAANVPPNAGSTSPGAHAE